MGRHIISTPLEHSSVSGTLTALQEQGYEIDLVDIRRDGTIDLDHLKELLRPDTIVVAVTRWWTVSWASCSQCKEIAEILKGMAHCHLHVDATQAVGKIPVSFEGVDTMSLTAHKFYGLNGIGLLIKRRGWRLSLSSMAAKVPPSTAAAPRLWRWPPRWRCALDLAVTDLPERAARVQKLNADPPHRAGKYPKVRINSPERAIPQILNLSVGTSKAPCSSGSWTPGASVSR